MSPNGQSIARKTEVELFGAFISQKKLELNLRDTALSKLSGIPRSTVIAVCSAPTKSGATIRVACALLRGVNSSLTEFDQYIEKYNRENPWLH